MLLRSGSEDSPLLGGADHNGRDSPSSWGSDPPSQPLERLLPPERNATHRSVHSQASMDSGCECDPSDVDTPHTSQTMRRTPPPESSRSKPPSPLVAPLAQKESLDCQCGTLDQTCICESCRRVVDTSPHVGTNMTHTDRGELPNIHSARLCTDRNSNTDSSTSKCVTNNIPTFKVTFRLGCDEEFEADPSTSPNGADSSSPTASEPGEEFRDLVRSATKSFPRVTSYSKPGMLSTSSSTASMPMCRICHFPQGEGADMLISPCRCSGTMQFIHEGCLMKWLEISSKRKKPATCELCYYQFNRHKKFKFNHWKLPTCSRVDKILHLVFLLCLLVMATCATITIYCFKQDRFIKKREETDLTQSEIVTLTCGVLFFVAFFMAMYVEVKAKDTLYKLLSKFLYLNQTWHIDEYDKRRDNQHTPV